ncbi:MAG: hypothetical protein ABIP49_03530 [Lysobacterales bacterium]
MATRKRAGTATDNVAERLLDLVGQIPTTSERIAADPHARAREIARKAAGKAGATSGAMALPPGVLGWMTILPELLALWKIQTQMVADIAGTYGKRSLLSREQMLYCLFNHTAAQAVGGLLVRIGERYVVRRAPIGTLYSIANKIALRIAQRSLRRGIFRWLPIAGALGVGAFAYADTGTVADAAIEVFSSDMVIEGEAEVEGVRAAQAAQRKPRAPAKKTTRKTAAKKARPAPRK